MKLALAIGGWAAGKRLGADPREILGRGAELIRSSPEFARLDEQVRGRLLEAGKAAAMAAATSRLSSLTDSLGDRAERLAAGGPLRAPRGAAAGPADTGVDASEPTADVDGTGDEDAVPEPAASDTGDDDDTPARPPRRRPAADAAPRQRATATGAARKPGTPTARSAAATGRAAAGKATRAGRGRPAAGGRAGGASARSRRGGDDG